MYTISQNWKWARKNHLLAIFSLILLQYHLHASVICAQATSSVQIVYMGWNRDDDPATTKKSHHKILSSLLGSKEAAKSSILYSYKHGFSGFAARLTESQAEAIADFPRVVQVIPNRIHKLQTTRSWDFIGINHHSPTNLLSKSNMGEGTIIGVIDTGVWPESESFNDEDMGPVPSHWKGICQQGERFNSKNCNKKIIGARWFIKGVRDIIKIPSNETDTIEFLSPRDGHGHGTHTASIAAGYFVKKANYKGLASGIARGGAPLAHLAIYKACWSFDTDVCTDADLLKAFDKAIHDGVDILSVSVGNEIPLFSYVDLRDTIAIGSFHATVKGITVVCSAGNDGPISQTVSNTAPWLITTAATTIDRAFPVGITLGNNRTIWGQSIDIGKHHHNFTSLTYSERIAIDSTDDLAKDCRRGSLNATMAAGKIVLCFSKSNEWDIVSASTSVLKAGGVGIIFAHFDYDGLQSCHIIPCIKVDYEVGAQILSYIRKARSPTVKLSTPRSVIGKWVSPRVASFSSRGPSSMSPSVLKPDIAAPGVDILAAFRSSEKNHNDRFALLSGTSMACPHVAGIAALLKSVHGNWSPAAIRSALVTTASQIGIDGTSISEDGPNRKATDPFDIGGGHVNPNKAVDPGLIYNISANDYVQFLCSMGYSNASITSLIKTTINCAEESHFGLNLNLPSITIPNLKRTVTVTRTVTNVGYFTSVYKVAVQAPYGIKMAVKPQTLSFNSTTQILSFKVTFFSTQKLYGDYKFGSLTWTDGKHLVRIPIAVRVGVIEFESYAYV
ncbi:hypothetical protein I3760_12G073300 [Carya illinoinensis]|nr:hypothetical protein I3760_12G073300 [Carya illinoinensis]